MTTTNPFGKRILILVPHPDDEVVGVAACARRALQNGAEIYALYVGHGCLPLAALWSWDKKNYPAYVARRLQEAEAVMNFMQLKKAGLNTTRAAREIWPALQAVWVEIQAAINTIQPDCVWVPAYEGGNPDHDGLNALASCIPNILGVSVFEFPEYHFATGRVVSNAFIDLRGDETVIKLNDDERIFKQKALRMYASEQNNLGAIACNQEMLRPLQPYDYSHPPHAGVLGYARFSWVPFKHPRVDFTKPADVCRAAETFLGAVK